MRLFFLLIVCLSSSPLTSAWPRRTQRSGCGFDTCHETMPGVLNVHMVPHSHDDVGWLKTVDEYFYGDKNEIARAGVQYIIDSVIRELSLDPEKRFIQVETAFFWRWWHEQNNATQDLVRSLVEAGQFEFIGGGWSMHDEAASHYSSFVDNMALGFKELKETFGSCGIPKVAWQIDPFGHSRENANLFAQMGFDGLFFARIDFEDRARRIANKELQVVWEGSDSLGESSSLFTGTFTVNNYHPPEGFCFDVRCEDDPVIDDPTLKEYNIEEKVNGFLEIANNYSESFITNHIIFTMGNGNKLVWEGSDPESEDTSIFTGVFAVHYEAPEGFCFDQRCQDDPIIDDPNLKEYNVDEKVDAFVAYAMEEVGSFINGNQMMFTMGTDFGYMNANQNFKSMDRLMKHANERTDETGVHFLYSTPSCFLKALNDEGETWPTKTDDFFPYASGELSYWTGYFTSRPAFKLHERLSNSLLQSSKQIDALTGGARNEELMRLRRAVAVSQHHDAITGTAKQTVDSDYHQSLSEGDALAQSAVRSSLLETFTSDQSIFDGFDSSFCMGSLNISACDLTESASNFLMFVYNPLPLIQDVRVRIPVKEGMSVSAYTENMDEVPLEMVPIPQQVIDIPGREESQAVIEAVLKVEQVPAMGYKTLLVKQETGSPDVAPIGTISVEEFYETILIDDISLKYYLANQNYNRQASGAYIFRPLSNTPQSPDIDTVYKVETETMLELRVTLEIDWSSFIYRVFKDDNTTEVEWLVGPIPIDDDQGKEAVLSYKSNLVNNGDVFYTDANGRQMIRRSRRRSDSTREPVAANYYPLTTAMYLADPVSGSELSVVTDRSQGGSSLSSSSQEVMVHRRLLVDDKFGVGEALNETAFGVGLVVRGKHVIDLSVDRSGEEWRRKKMRESYLQPLVMFQETDLEPEDIAGLGANWEHGWIQEELPGNANVLTLETWDEDSLVLLRLENMYHEGNVATVNLDGLFNSFTINDIVEMTLGANMELSEKDRLHWNTAKWGPSHDKTHPMMRDEPRIDEIDLQPSEIRTFLLDVTWNE